MVKRLSSVMERLGELGWEACGQVRPKRFHDKRMIPPGIPKELMATTSTDKSLELHWRAVDGAFDYTFRVLDDLRKLVCDKAGIPVPAAPSPEASEETENDSEPQDAPEESAEVGVKE